jgi:hypothetical protein
MNRDQYNIASALIEWSKIQPETLAMAIPKEEQPG